MSAYIIRRLLLIIPINLFFATAVVLFNLLIDLIYSWLDPRVRYRSNG